MRLSIGVLALCCGAVNAAPNQVDVALTECPASDSLTMQITPWVAVLAVPLVEHLVKSLGENLIAASGKNKPIHTAQGLARGSFYSIDKNAVRILNPSIACIAATVGSDLTLAVRIELSPDKSAMAIIPIEATYRRAIGKNRSIKSLSATVDLLSADGTTFASAALPLGLTTHPNLTLDAAALQHAQSGWLPLLVPSTESNSAFNALNEKRARQTEIEHLLKTAESEAVRTLLVKELDLLREQTAGSLMQLKDHGPVTVRVTFAETRNVNEFLAVLGESISGKSSELTKLATDRWFAAPAAEAERAAHTTAVGAYWAARYKFDEAVRIYSEVSSDPNGTASARSTAKIVAIQAQYAALAAAITAGVVLDSDDPLRTFRP